MLPTILPITDLAARYITFEFFFPFVKVMVILPGSISNPENVIFCFGGC